MMRAVPTERGIGKPGASSEIAAAAAPSPTRLYGLLYLVSRPLVEKVYRLRVEGLGQVPAQGGFVVAANHTSNLDPWPLGIALWPRSLHFMAKHEAWRPPLKWLMAMFPEGTRRSKGLRKKHKPRPHSGAARIALAAGVPLLPAALRGMDRLSRLGPLRLRLGAAIPLEDLRELDSHAAAEEATKRLWAEIQRLEAELDAEG